MMKLDKDELALAVAIEAALAIYLTSANREVFGEIFNPAAIANADNDWDNEVEEILAAVFLLWVNRGGQETAFLDFASSLRVHLLKVKESVVERMNLAISFVEAPDMAEDAARNALRMREWTNHVALVAVTTATATINGAEFSQPTAPGASKVWKSMHDGRTRSSHLAADGQTVGINDLFSIGGYSGRYPGDPSLPVWEVANCRCRLEIRGADGVIAVSWGHGKPGDEDLSTMPGGKVAGSVHGAPGTNGRTTALVQPVPSGGRPGVQVSGEVRPSASRGGPTARQGQTSAQDLRDLARRVGGDVRRTGPDMQILQQHAADAPLVGDGSLSQDGAGPRDRLPAVQSADGILGDRVADAVRGRTEGVSEMTYKSAWTDAAWDCEPARAIIAAVQDLSEETIRERGLPNGWRGIMAPLGVPTGDDRQLNIPEGGLRTREIPMSFLWAPSNEGGHQGSRMAGRIDRVWEENGAMMGEGALDIWGADGGEFARQLGSGFAFQVSIDPDEVTFTLEFRDKDGNPATLEEATELDGDGEDALRSLKEGYRTLHVMSDWRLAAVTAVTIPAFDQARIEPVWDYGLEEDPADDEQDALLDAHDAEITDHPHAALAELLMETAKALLASTQPVVAAVTGATKLPVAGNRKHKWDGHKARQRVMQWASSDGSGDLEKIDFGKASRAFLWLGEPGTGNAIVYDDEISAEFANGHRVEDFKLGIADVIEGQLVIIPNAIWAAAAGHGVTATKGIPDAAKSQIKSKICSLYARVRSVHKDFPECPFQAKEAAVVAAAGQVFRATSFANPNFKAPTPMTVTEDGRVYGHAALWSSCYQYRGGDGNTCEPPPRNDDFSNFLVHGARLDDGSILPVGALTYGDGHVARGGLRASQKHYADVSTMAAKVTCGVDKYGIWVAGEVLDSHRDKADDILLSPLSFHWEPDPQKYGKLSAIAAHIVVTPGFRVPALIATAGDGENPGLIVFAAPAAPDRAEAAKAKFRAKNAARAFTKRHTVSTDTASEES